jgi:hypothetical protein
MITMRPITEDGVRKFTLGNGLVFSVDQLPPNLRQRWDLCCADIERGRNVAGALKALTEETTTALWPDIAARAAQSGPRSVLDLGIITKETHGATFKPLTTMAEEHAAEEREKEGVKDKRRLAGSRPCPLCGK